MIKYIENSQQWQTLMKISKTKLVVVEFEASWCSACSYISPFLESLSDFKDVDFSKIDIDRARGLANENGVRSMPTFYFFKNGIKIHELVGANFQNLVSMIVQLK